MQPTRAALVSLLVVFVLLSALLAKCLQTSRLGVVNLCDRFTAKKKLDFVFTVSVGISEDALGDEVMTGCVLDVWVDVGDQAMWDDARWESRVDKGAGVDTEQGGREGGEGKGGGS